MHKLFAKKLFHRIRTMRRWLVVLYTLGMSVMLSASCSNVLGLEGHASAVSELCVLVERCYGPEMLADCDARLGEHLMAASSDARADWLRDFGNRACLESCTNAWFCLDTVPVCGATGNSCTTPEGCCGFTDSRGDCSAVGSCCISKGHPCEDGSDCCVGQCRDGVCGGQVCGAEGEACQLPSDCCSGVCVDESCGGVCLPPGAECQDPADCCSNTCVFAGASEERGICDVVNCLDAFMPCEPGVAPDCCNGQCVFSPAYGGYACIEDCWPAGTACGNDGGLCCSQACINGVCDALDMGEGGGGAGGGNQAPTCEPLGEQCNTAGECCAQQCFQGACCQHASDATVCDTDVCTTTLTTPKSVQCTCGLPACEDKVGCVAAVCADDPWCCCVGWDQFCVQQAETHCGVLCPVMTGRQQPQ